jgi:hypothetical protein
MHSSPGGTLLAAVTADASSRLYLIVGPGNAKQLSVLLAEAASPSQMTPNGGVIAGIEVLVSDAVSPTQMVLLDATAFAAGVSDLTLSAMSHASVQLDASPDSLTTSVTNILSLWQLNQIGLLAERFFLAERLRTGSVAVVNASYASGFSP